MRTSPPKLLLSRPRQFQEKKTYFVMVPASQLMSQLRRLWFFDTYGWVNRPQPDDQILTEDTLLICTRADAADDTYRFRKPTRQPAAVQIARARTDWVNLKLNFHWKPPATVKVSHLHVHEDHSTRDTLRGFRYTKANTNLLSGGNLHFLGPDEQRVEIFHEGLVTRNLDIWQARETVRRDTVGQTFRLYATPGNFFTTRG